MYHLLTGFNAYCKIKMSHFHLKESENYAEIKGKTGTKPLTFNQVVRGSNPRTLSFKMRRKSLKIEGLRFFVI